MCHEDYEDLIGKSGERKLAKSKDLIGIQRQLFIVEIRMCYRILGLGILLSL